jgi:hypothetical protein
MIGCLEPQIRTTNMLKIFRNIPFKVMIFEKFIFTLKIEILLTVPHCKICGAVQRNNG